MQIEQHSTIHQSSRGSLKPDMIVWHIADGSYSGTIAWEKNPASKISSHFVLAKDGRVAQLVPLDKAAWTQGIVSKPTSDIVKSRNVNPNLYSISVECEGLWKDTKGKLTNPALKSATELTEYIISEVKRIYGITIPRDRKHIIGHYEINPVSRSHCPGELFPFDEIIQNKVKPDKPTLSVNDIVRIKGRLHLSSYGGDEGQVTYNDYRGKITKINPNSKYPYLIDNGKGWAGMDNIILGDA